MSNISTLQGINMTNDYAIEYHFPLNDMDIVKILKGVEYHQIKYLADGQKVHIRVYSSDRVKHISWENWRKIVASCYSNPDLEKIIRFIELENEHGLVK